MMLLKIIRIAYLFLFVVVAIVSCAKMGYPSGGPTDTTPPEVDEYKPDNRTINFNAKKIEITFNEFVQLKDLQGSYIASPPMEKKPEVTLKGGGGKTIVVKFMEDLKPNTTYRLYFGNSIVDLNNSNPISNFEYVFSTGNHIDSLAIRGQLLNSFTIKPEKDPFYVMLYSKFHDSIPRKQLPDYIAKTDKNGFFSLGHIRPDTFLMFALKDMNQNLKFDLPNENIAFVDTLINLNTNYYMPDSVLNDTTIIDTITKATFRPQIHLYSFEEYHKKQYFKKIERLTPEFISFIFNIRPDDSLRIVPLNFDDWNWKLLDIKNFGDTISFWITDTALLQKDTLRMQMKFTVLDSLDKPISRIDTIEAIYKKVKPTGRKSKEIVRNKLSNFLISSNISENSSAFDLNEKITLTTSLPFINFDKTRIKLTRREEEKKFAVKFDLKKDSSNARLFILSAKLEPKAQYSLSIDTLTFLSIYFQNNDSLGFDFETQRDDFYGTIYANIQGVVGNVILQLLLDDKLQQQFFLNTDKKILFTFLKPGTYRLRAIFDTNHNNKWDTGIFEERLEPERVIYFEKEMKIRSNFDMEETWDLNINTKK